MLTSDLYTHTKPNGMFLGISVQNHQSQKNDGFSYHSQEIPLTTHFRELSPPPQKKKNWLYSDLTPKQPGPFHLLKIPQNCLDFGNSSIVVANIDVIEAANKSGDTDSSPATQLTRRASCLLRNSGTCSQALGEPPNSFAATAITLPTVQLLFLVIT